MQKFWMVWCEDSGGGRPTFKHYTEQAAREEAERLARAHGKVFVVLESMSAVKKSDVQWTECDECEDYEIKMPF